MSEKIIYIPNFIQNPYEIFKKLREELNWEKRDAPRQEYYTNDYNIPYTYGRGNGIRQYNPQPYHEEILNIRKLIEKICNCVFETCFLNRYLHQRDWLGWHADDSPEMDPNRPICIVSLGIARIIKFQKQTIIENENGTKHTKYDYCFEKLLENGSLCIMPAGFQQTHKHCIPKAGFQTNMSEGFEYHFWGKNFFDLQGVFA